jgi:hypothetical protein
MGLYPMKPELRRIVLGLLIVGFAFAIVLVIAKVHPADFEAAGFKVCKPRNCSNIDIGSAISAACGGKPLSKAAALS